MDSSAIFLLAPTVFSSATYAAMLGACAVGVTRARRAAGASAMRGATRAPRVSILKPLAGADDELAANLATFGALDYPEYEVLVGVASLDDAAYPIARAFAARHPDRARVVVTDPDAALNPKVAQLVGLDARATGEVVVVSDSNVRVAPGYLWSLARELEAPGVGLVTSLFVGAGERSIGAALENLQIGASTAPGIVSTNLLTPWPLTIGKSMAMRRRDLVRLGGFARFGGVLAEDQALGRAFVAAGFGVRTSLDAIENRNVACTGRRTLERHTRWAKLRRALHPAGFACEPLLSPLATATVVALIAPSRVSLAAVAVAAAGQTIAALAMVRLLRGHALPWRYAPLEIVRTYVALGCWLAAWGSMRVAWRGHAFVLGRGSAITPVAGADPAKESPWSQLFAQLRGRLRGA